MAESKQMVKNLQKKIKLVEAIVAHPKATNIELAEMVDVNRNTITSWKRDENFQKMLKERMQDLWRDSEVIAVTNMRKLANEGNFYANKYILDSMGYAPAQRIDANVNADIEITIE